VFCVQYSVLCIFIVCYACRKITLTSFCHVATGSKKQRLDMNMCYLYS